MSLKLNSSGGGSVTLQEPVTASTLTLTLPAFSGTAATLASVTNNGVLFVNGSGQPTSGSALTFDGTNLVLGGVQRINGTSTSGLTLTSNSGSTSGFKLYNDSGTDIAYLMNYYNGSMVFGINNSEQMRLTSTGLGIGTSSPSYKLDAQTTATGTAAGDNTVGYFGSLASGRDANIRFGDSVNASARIGYLSGALYMYTNGAERLRLDISGNLLVGTTNTSIFSGEGIKLLTDTARRISVVSSASTTGGGETYLMYSTGAAAYRFYVSWGGQIFATSTSITAISDASLKENIRDLDTGLAQVMALKPRRFDWKAETAIDEKNVAGFVAQEVEEVLPELVYDYKYSQEKTKKALKMGDMVPTLVKAIQEQQAMIAQLQADIASLKGTA